MDGQRARQRANDGGMPFSEHQSELTLGDGPNYPHALNSLVTDIGETSDRMRDEVALRSQLDSGPHMFAA